jgi:hypothetical protein
VEASVLPEVAALIEKYGLGLEVKKVERRETLFFVGVMSQLRCKTVH